jgi:sugar lactone lactonase YvrE
VWLNDDGGEEQGKGSRLLSLDRNGKISVLAGIGKLLPVTGFDVAPATFGSFGGQIFTLAQARTGTEGVNVNHIIQRVDPARGYAATVYCTLPNAGTAGKGIPGLGLDARFGPEGSPFAGKFFAVTGSNNTIYQVTSDGACTPFVTLDGKPLTSPFALAFTTDGKSMLVTGRKAGASTGAAGAIGRVTAEGKVEEKLVAEGIGRPTGLAFAPQGFGAYAGQLFVGDLQSGQVPMTQRLAADGKVYRVTPDGAIHLVASGFVNPIGMRFIDRKLWVTDINGDFIAGRRELPDGFIVEIGIR